MKNIPSIIVNLNDNNLYIMDDGMFIKLGGNGFTNMPVKFCNATFRFYVEYYERSARNTSILFRDGRSFDFKEDGRIRLYLEWNEFSLEQYHFILMMCSAVHNIEYKILPIGHVIVIPNGLSPENSKTLINYLKEIHGNILIDDYTRRIVLI